MSNYKKHLHIGPGGRKCTCCFPSPGSRDRRAAYRTAKRRADMAAKREIEDGLNEIADMAAEAFQAEYDAEMDAELQADMTSYYDQLQDMYEAERREYYAQLESTSELEDEYRGWSDDFNGEW